MVSTEGEGNFSQRFMFPDPLASLQFPEMLKCPQTSHMPHDHRPFIFCRLDLAESQDVRKFRDHPPWLQDLTNPLGSVLTQAFTCLPPCVATTWLCPILPSL